ncbi:MAG: acyl-CoA desaturase [Bacteroidota bacterium]
MNAPKFAHTSSSIHHEFRKRINDYFSHKGIAHTGNAQLYIKAIILISSYVAVYIHLVFFTPIVWVAIPECMLMGILTAALGFNIMHDGAHGSFSKHKWLNRLAALSLDFLGASSFMWNTKHNVVHHAYTNIDGIDDDINARPFLRLCDTQKYYKVHKYQHLYFGFLYSLLYMFWVFFTDYKKYFTNHVGIMPVQKMKWSDHVIFWASKILHILVYIVVPIYFVGFAYWISGFLIYSCVAGFVLSIVFQLAHTVEETSFPQAVQPMNKIEDEWALHQLKTTANFATTNKFITWMVGGLNFQVEHHLFPKISHIHYPAISKIVRDTCKEMGVTYIEHPKMRQAVASHVMHLKRMGQHA